MSKKPAALRQVKFVKFGANSQFGGFAPGDKMRCDPALAQHLVDEGVAVYHDAQTTTTTAAPPTTTSAAPTTTTAAPPTTEAPTTTTVAPTTEAPPTTAAPTTAAPTEKKARK